MSRRALSQVPPAGPLLLAPGLRSAPGRLRGPGELLPLHGEGAELRRDAPRAPCALRVHEVAPGGLRRTAGDRAHR